MKNKKSISFLCLSIILTTILLIPLSAKGESFDQSDINYGNIYIEAPENATEQEKIDLIEKVIDSSQKTRAGKKEIVASFAVVRSGKTKKCELYFNGKGGYSFNELKISEVAVGNTSFLKPKTYGSFKNVRKKFEAGKTRTVSIGRMNVPTGEKKVLIASKGIKAYALSKGWITLYHKSGTIKVN